MGKPLSRRQQMMLEYIERFLEENTYPPTIREIQRDLNISSTSVVDYNLNILEQRNLIRRNRNISRGIELVNRPVPVRNIVQVPVIGQIAAGEPIPVLDDVVVDETTETINISSDLIGSRTDGLFALRVKGTSMIDALINDGDIVILRHQQTCENGETVAVWLRAEKETTLKRFYHEGSRIRLQPANATMSPIYTTPDNVEIQGKLVTVVRPYS
ncbi:transcriptional repressor LexA [Sphaerobacter sp.]|uniref:transcriptional repressor LexA n=1 Tax=Sphaerobacter sp. TaxID=2099654 RepID=UPI001E04B27E|nr:transcriptional repressor LexA [Sphaerobacter sp.]MBX5444791.1 transcriptional repressor LexA [Sphaerobacter sp.]